MREQAHVLPNGQTGQLLSIPSTNPRNYQDIMAQRHASSVDLDATLYLPQVRRRCPAVIIIPGSGGVSVWMLHHAQALVATGMAVLVVDPFTPRGVVNTIAVQQQFSFAASTFDVFAAVHYLRQHNAIDGQRIGAMGYSRGGTAVLQAAIAQLGRHALGGQATPNAVLAAWPWCGYQFSQPDTGAVRVRVLAADKDNWASSLQTQAYFQAIHARNTSATFRLFKDARHGFGYGNPLTDLPDAMVALNAPILYFDPQGVLQDPWSGAVIDDADDHHIRRMLLPFISRGVSVGSQGSQMADFMADAAHFLSESLQTDALFAAIEPCIAP
jgi:dienelactone hydrolase